MRTQCGTILAAEPVTRRVYPRWKLMMREFLHRGAERQILRPAVFGVLVAVAAALPRIVAAGGLSEAEVDSLCPPRAETAAAFKAGAYPPAARSYREAALRAFAYMTSLPAMRTLVEKGEPEQAYQHNAYVSKTHAAHVNRMLEWARRDPARREEAMRFASASAGYLLSQLEPPEAPLAWWPPTYGRTPLRRDPADGGAKRLAMVGSEPEGAVKYRGEVMLVYPADVGKAFVAYYGETGDSRFLAAARGIGETYFKTRRPDGSWPLKMRLATGEPVGENTLVPTRPMVFFRALAEATGEKRWAEASDACFAWLEAHPLSDWNWDGQFEDIQPRPSYVNPTKHNAVEAMFEILRRFPGDPARLEQCRRILRFCERRFVCWERPANHPKWDAPSVLEQYSCFLPIDSSASKMIRAYLALWRVTGEPELLAKARALGDTITRVQTPEGRIPTFWTHDTLGLPLYDWLNCMESSASALLELDDAIAEVGAASSRPAGVGSHGEGSVLEGAVGRKARALFHERLLCAKARGDIFDEALNAFATRMDDLHPYAPNATNHYGWWQGEYWGKTMLCQCAFARYSGREDVRAFVHEKALELVRRFQRPDGYLSSYDDQDHVFGFNWNVWCRKYTTWALVEAYDLTGDKEFLVAAGRVVDHLASQLRRLDVPLAGTGYFSGIPSLSILKPAVMLAERTGERRYMDFARAIVMDNDRPDGRIPNIVANAFGPRPVHEWYPSPNKWAKAYELMSVVEGLIAFSKATGERRPLDAAVRIWEKLKAAELNPVESVGYHDHFTGAAAEVNAISEVCDVIHWMRLCRYLNEATGEAKYLDAWEAAFLNAFLAGVYRDGSWGAHDVRSHGRRHLQGLYEVGMTYHFCCIDNAPRAFCDWADRQVVLSDDGTVDVNFYTDCVFSGDGCSAKISGNYPVGGTVRMTVRSEKPRRIRFRIPGWCRGGMTVDGTKAVDAAGFAESSVECGERTFVVAFDMKPRIERSAATRTGGKMDKESAEMFEMSWHNPEMAGFARKEPGVRILRGPFVLAKARLAGCDDRTCFSDIAGLGDGWSATLRPVPNAKTWGAWELTLEGAGEKRVVGVCDYMSAADFDDPRNAFSIWF